MINRLSDIQIGKEYLLLQSRDKRRVRKAVVHGIINEDVTFPSTGITEIYLSIFRAGRFSSRNLVQAAWVGIGETKEEAFRNFGRFRYEENNTFDNSLEQVKVRMGDNQG